MADRVNSSRYRFVLRHLWRTIVHTVHLYAEYETGQRAAALAYYGLLSLFPLFLLAFNFLVRWLSAPHARQTLLGMLSRLAPAVPELVTQSLARTVNIQGSLNLVAALGLTWSASGLFASLIHSLDRVWNGRSGRTFWEHRLLSILLVFVILLLFIFSLLLQTMLALLPWLMAFFLPISPLVLQETLRLLSAVVSLAFDVFLYGMLFRYLPTRRPAWSAVWAGAVVAGIGWNGAKLGFAWYLSHFARYGLVYGTLATLVAFLFWLYLSGLVLLIGAEFGAAWEANWNLGREE